MRTFYREIRELLRGPEFVALTVIYLLLAAGDGGFVHMAGDPGELADRVRQILAPAPLEELLDRLHWAMPWLR